MKDSFSKIVHCARPHLWIFISLNATISGFIAGLGTVDALLFALSLCLLASFGFILNDIVDREIDKEIHLDRLALVDPATLRLAHISMWLILLLGLVIANFLGVNALLAALFIAVSLSTYSLVFRKQLLIATIICSTATTSPLWAPFLVSGIFMPLFHLVIVWVSFVLLAARETILDMKDARGDLIGKRHTIATLMGDRVSMIVAAILTVTGLATLLGVCISRILTLSFIEAAVLTAGLGCFSWLILGPTIRLVTSEQPNKQILDTYVLQTRRAMAIIPLFILIDWLS